MTAGPDPEAMAAIAGGAPGAAPLRATTGQVLFRPGDPCHGFVALKRGAIRVGLTSVAGRELLLYRVRPGQICLQTFACLVEGRLYAAEGVVETDVEGVLLPPAAFDRLMAENAAFRSCVMGSVASRFGDLEGVVQALAFTGLPSRLAAALLAQSVNGAVNLTHEALAAEIGSAREAVGRQLSQMAREGLVSLGRGNIRLVDVGALQGLARTEV
ncbi:MAG TPA: Crp/Fnr family transcriptional regulator [Caulobacter sp.]|nr:Crp/Fnr family transcriptional regulator [Caulobacter sp.]